MTIIKNDIGLNNFEKRNSFIFVKEKERDKS